MLTAKQAQQKALVNEIMGLESLINSAIEGGLINASTTAMLSIKAIMILRDYGYTVKEQSSITYIIWGK